MAWNHYVEEQTAKGEVLDLLQLAPAPVPDGENFFSTPLWEPFQFQMIDGHPVWADTNWHTYASFDISGPRRTSSSGRSSTWSRGEQQDLTEWQALYRGSNNVVATTEGGVTNYFPVSEEPQSPAEDVLLALSRFDDQRQFLVDACSRPRARFWINYEDGFAALLPHLAKLKGMVQYLSLHSVAASRAGDTNTAYEDVMMSLRLLESVRNEPIVISQLVRIAMLEIMTQAIWEGVAYRRWNDDQLASLESELAKLDFVADYRLAMRGERAFCVWNIDYVQRNRSLGARELMDMGSSRPERKWWQPFLVGAGIQLAPSGWFDLSKVATCRAINHELLPIASTRSNTISPILAQKGQENLEKRSSLYDVPVRYWMPALAGAAPKFAISQTTVDLARVGIAIERFRLANGDFPKSLDSLAPRFIDAVPQDVVNGQPLHYRRTADDRYLLYSVGWNQTDDGGEAALTSSGNTINREEGDWVWELPDPKLQPY